MADENEAAESDDAAAGKVKHRSPNYPLFDLEKAVELAEKMYGTDKMHKVPIGVAHDRWGYKKLSAAGNQAVGAMKSYGLVSVEGSGDKRLITITDAGRRIVLNTPERPNLIKEAALGPDLFRSLWERYGADGLPADDVLTHHLILDRKFNDDSVQSAIDRFKNTVAFAKLGPDDKMDDEVDGHVEPKNDGPKAKTPPDPVDQKTKRRPLMPGTIEDTLTLPEGLIAIQLPGEFSSEGYEDFESWLEIVKRKAKRSIAKNRPENHGTDEQAE